jgi:hypothetical protein
VTAWFKLPGDEEWRGSLTWSTADTAMTFDVLRPAEWKFELRRESSVEPDPVVRTVVVGEGDSVVVDE